MLAVLGLVAAPAFAAFGATIELDQRVYTWTDRVFITIVDRGGNLDGNRIDYIGDEVGELQIYTTDDTIYGYALEETGRDTGIFVGEVTLTGFDYLPVRATVRGPSGIGPTDGLLPASDNDEITVVYTDADGGYTIVSSLIRWNVGEVEWSKGSYDGDGAGIVRVIDPDMNTSPTAIDRFEITVKSRASPAGMKISVTETGAASGIFEGTVEFAEGRQAAGRLHVRGGDTVTATYSDQTLPSSDARGSRIDITATAAITQEAPAGRGPVTETAPAARGTITIELDQRVYTWTDSVFITVTDRGRNFDKTAIDTIGGAEGGGPLSVYTKGGRIDGYILREAGINTGIFTGSVTLGGTSYKLPDTAVIQRGPSGTGPTDGVLPAGSDDEITVSYEYETDKILTGSAPIRWNEGEAEWTGEPYAAGDVGVLRIIDPDRNLRPGHVEDFEVTVASGSDPGGVPILVRETSKASGIFEGRVLLSGESAEYRSLRAPGGDTVTASYVDATMPKPHRMGDKVTVTATARIGGQAPPPEPEPEPEPAADRALRQASGMQMGISEARITDSSGNRVSSVDSGERVRLTATFSNNVDRFQEFAYVAEIQGGGDTETMHRVTQLAPWASASSGLSWTPKEPGTYMVTVSARPSAESTRQLAAPAIFAVDVEGDIPAIEKISLGRPAVGDGEIRAGQEVEVTSRITNNQDMDQRHVYIVRITDESGDIAYITWAIEDVAANGELRPSVSWVPEKPGRYEVATFVWSSLVNTPEALSTPSSTTVHVVDPR
ncbi:MAG: hypothetical protein MPK30_08745 [Gammaproteobacteria bacterium]|nr:hypothetical protein [Gammaproteobacteria bacterium]